MNHDSQRGPQLTTRGPRPPLRRAGSPAPGSRRGCPRRLARLNHPMPDRAGQRIRDWSARTVTAQEADRGTLTACPERGVFSKSLPESPRPPRQLGQTPGKITGGGAAAASVRARVGQGWPGRAREKVNQGLLKDEVNVSIVFRRSLSSLKQKDSAHGLHHEKQDHESDV